MSAVAFAAAAHLPSYHQEPGYPAHQSYDHKPAYPAHQTYDHKPSYKHKEYDYVGYILNFESHLFQFKHDPMSLLQAPAYYNFDYAVKDDYTYVDFGHNEHRDGDNTKGSYYVVLPDGRRQVVTYYVDGYSGYVADVKYEGEAKYDYKPAYKPDYKSEY